LPLYFLDTSALVKLYVREVGTERLLRLADRATSNRLAVLALAQVEIHSAVRRRERAGDIDVSIASLILDNLDHDMQGRFLRQTLNDPVLDMACALVDRHFLRAYDAIQLAGCLSMKVAAGADALVFVCSDRRLLQAAVLEGLSTLNPEIMWGDET
jgi:uncharacterized protein